MTEKTKGAKTGINNWSGSGYGRAGDFDLPTTIDEAVAIQPPSTVGPFQIIGDVRPQVWQGLSPRKLLQLQHFIESNLTQDLCLDDLRKVVNLSREHLIRSFKKATGVTPHRYILEARIEMAKEILLSERRSMAEIALALGFCSQSHFSDTFRRFTGMSPRCFLRFRRDQCRTEQLSEGASPI